ncbi:MAG: class II aldolase/adducin family protein [Acetobacteraceae bacterium]|nr:class II aldolase/adducin family protein [Acetobacteraceae bacterium]
MDDGEPRQALAELYRALGRHGLIAGSSGNVSLRIPEGMLITPSGGSPDSTGGEALVPARLDGSVLGGAQPGAVPSSEWHMHARIYGDRADAQCIVHAHSDACTALACLGERLPPFHYMIANFGGDDVRCAPYVTFGTEALAAAAMRALEGRSACLLANHGMVLHAGSAAGALRSALLLESLARQYLLARAAGPLRLLTDAEMRDAHIRFRSYDAGLG